MVSPWQMNSKGTPKTEFTIPNHPIINPIVLQPKSLLNWLKSILNLAFDYGAAIQILR